MEEVTRRHFYQHERPDELDPKEKERCHFCQLRSFATHSKFPVSIVNRSEKHKKSTLNPDFRFIENSVITRGVPNAPDTFRSGCECEENEGCMYSTCHCLQDMAPDSDEEADDDGMPKKRFAYYSTGQKAGLLRRRILESRNPIYECHALCNCTPDCPNRVVERGRTVPLQIFRTDNRGWGVRCPVPLRKGQFVDRYLGEIITQKEADKRRAASSLAQRKDVYLFALDKFTDPDSPDPWLRESVMVDGEFMSGPTRFVNHSCDPNMRIFARVGDYADRVTHDLAFFAVRDIPQNEELTFDYVDGVVGLDDDAKDPKNHKDMTESGVSGSARAINDGPQTAGASGSQAGNDDPLQSPASVSHRRHRNQLLSQHINKPLRRHEWSSRNRVWTSAALKRERVEFFDTRVTGRQEVWQTIRAALEVLWIADAAARDGQTRREAGLGGPSEEDPAIALATAQSILDAADITLPSGDLAQGAYDSLGNYYSMPEYIVSDPLNLSQGPALGDSFEDAKADFTAGEETAEETEEGDEVERRREEKGKAVLDVRDLISVRARLSDGSKDVIVSVGKEDNVRTIARSITEGAQLPPNKKVRIAYMGKILKEGSSLPEQGWKSGHVVNALVFNR
ncbi:hypothetical protein OQA88_2857 [Cercophora sp. LCS_1]